MCKSVQDYAEKYAEKYAIFTYIDGLKEFTDDEEVILQKVMNKYSFTHEQAKSYYDESITTCN